MDNDRVGQPRQVRPPGFDEPGPATRPGTAWYRDYGGPPGYWVPTGRSREVGIHAARRASSWTAAALIAGVAVATGYLAHAVPATGSGSVGTEHHKPGVPGSAVPAAPAPGGPVVTSGGSGAAGAGRAGD